MLFRSDSLTEAVAAHRAAVTQDPDFADAWAALAQTAVTLAGWDTDNAADHLAPMREALVQLGALAVWVVHGEDGLDEISPGARTRAAVHGPDGARELTKLQKVALDGAA